MRRDGLEKIGGIAATADFYSDDLCLGNLIGRPDIKSSFPPPCYSACTHAALFGSNLGGQLRWIEHTILASLGHVGTGLTYAVPFGLLGLFEGWPLGMECSEFGCLRWPAKIEWCNLQPWVGELSATSERFIYPGFIRFAIFCGFLTWAGSFGSRTFFWRGETYRFSRGGRIIPQNRPAESAVGAKL